MILLIAFLAVSRREGVKARGATELAFDFRLREIYRCLVCSRAIQDEDGSIWTCLTCFPLRSSNCKNNRRPGGKIVMNSSSRRDLSLAIGTAKAHKSGSFSVLDC